MDTNILEKHNIKKGSTLHNFIMRMVLLAIGGTMTVIGFNIEYQSHLIVRLIYLVFVILMVIEMHRLLQATIIKPKNIIVSLFAGLLFPTYVVLEAYVLKSTIIRPHSLIVLIFLIFAIFALCNAWQNILNEIISAIFIAIYPGLLASYWLLIPNFSNATLHFFALTGGAYVIDGFSYLVGFSLGRFESKARSKPLLTVSPKKTITGFVGGAMFGYLYFFILYYINSDMFRNSIPKTILFASVIITAVFLGDLFESAIKRVLKVKDSGTLMLGRGGVLDTLDSLIFTAPIYVILYPIIFMM